MKNLFSGDIKKNKLIPLIIDDLSHKELPLLIKNIKVTRYSNQREYKKLIDFLKKMG